MPTLTFPNIRANREDWGLVFNTQVFPSPLTGATQTAELPGARWEATLSFNKREGREARALQAFLTALRGRAGRFYLSPAESAPLGTALGTGLVDGANQTGGSILTKDWTANQSLLFAAGDFIEIGGELKQVSEDVSSDGAGAATITFAPDIRKSPVTDTPVVKDNPSVLMRLETDTQASWATSSPIIYALSLSCVEPLDA